MLPNFIHRKKRSGSMKLKDFFSNRGRTYYSELLSSHYIFTFTEILLREIVLECPAKRFFNI